MDQKHLHVQYNRVKKCYNVVPGGHSSHERGRAGALLLLAALSTQHSALRRVVKKSTYRGFPLPKAPKTSGGAHFLRGRKPFWWKNHQMLLSLSTTFYFRSISITWSMAFVCNSTRSIT